MIKANKYPPRPTAEPLWGSHPDYVTKIKGRYAPFFFGNFGGDIPRRSYQKGRISASFYFGDPPGIRTPDHRIKSAVLYRLS